MYLKYLVTGQSDNKPSIHKIFNIWNNYFFPSTARYRHSTLTCAPSHIIYDTFAALANDPEEADDNLLDSHSYTDNSGNQGGGSVDTGESLGHMPDPLTVLQSQKVTLSKDLQFRISPGVEVLSLVRTCAGHLNEQRVTDSLAVKGRGRKNARVNADNGNAPPAKGKGKGRVEGGNS